MVPTCLNLIIQGYSTPWKVVGPVEWRWGLSGQPEWLVNKCWHRTSLGGLVLYVRIDEETLSSQLAPNHRPKSRGEIWSQPTVRLAKIIGIVLDPNTWQSLGLSHTGDALVFTTGTCLAVAVPSSTDYYACLGKFYLILKIQWAESRNKNGSPQRSVASYLACCLFC